jgi:TonB family protein
MHAIAKKHPFRVGVTSSIAMHIAIGLFIVYVLTYQPPPILITSVPPMIQAVPVILAKPQPQKKPESKLALEQAEETPPEEPPPPPPEVEMAPSPSYLALVHGMLEVHKRYPRRALERGDQGVVVLWFVIDRYGQVVNYRIEQSSGSTILDGEVVRLIKRVNKFPMLPDDLTRDFLEITMPVRFVITDL